MTARIAICLMALLACLTRAEPPAQHDLPRQNLTRMKPDERASLERLLRVGFPGFGDHGAVLSGKQADIDSFAGRVAVIQAWEFDDPNSQRAVQQLGESLDGLESVVLVALHPPEDADKIGRVLDRRPLPGVVLLDNEDLYVNPLGLGVRGANVIVDRHGAVRYVGISPAGVRALVLELLDEKPDPARAPTADISGFAESREGSARLCAQLDDAWSAGDLESGERILDQLWQSDATTAARLSRDLLDSSSSLQHVLGVSQLARHAPASTLLDTIGRLNPRQDRIEISVLVRALGSRELEQPESALAPFLGSRETIVRQAALYALGDLAAPEALSLFVAELRDAPVVSDTWTTDEPDRLMSTMFGVAYKFSGLRGQNGADYESWLGEHRADPAAAKAAAERSVRDAQGRPLSVEFSSDTFETYPGFDLAYRIADSGSEEADPRTPAQFVAALESTREAAAPVLGRVYVAPIRVFIADDRGFASLAGNTFMGGQAEVNKLFIRAGRSSTMVQLFSHEYAHILHQAMYDHQPRWLSEGFAESVANPDYRWDARRVSSLGLGQSVDEGVFARLLSWGSAASSDEREGENYRLSNLAVDFLRFGPFPAGDTRLGMFMAELSLGRGEREALAGLYADPGQLDEQIRVWLRSP